MRFRDRRDAGRQLTDELRDFAGRDDVVALGLPRGGVPVAREIADGLGVALDVFVVRKLGVPGRPELAFGAIASGGVHVLNPGVLAAAGLSEEAIIDVLAGEQAELARRESAYGPAAGIRDVAIIVDDGVATGATMCAAVQAARQAGAVTVIAAAPVAAPAAVARIRELADDVRMLATPVSFAAVGAFYDDFDEVSDDDVRRSLAR